MEVIPGLTAACSGAALLGAPLTHDFAVVSLSDRLTPWEKIAARLRAAAGADLTIVLYNPASRGRPDHLRRAVDILLETLPYEHIRWIVNRDIDPMKITGTTDMKRIKDLKGNPLLLFINPWSVGMVLDRNEGLELENFSRN